jgi:LacI family transcriptional regulator
MTSLNAGRRPTLLDVAALAGVSIKTASRVVNGEGGVVADKVNAVQRAVHELDYQQNIAASSLRRADGRTAAVGVLLEDLANPFSAEVHRALEDVAREHGVVVFASSVDEDPVRERQLVRAFTARRADALVIVPATRDQGYLEREVADGTPVVFVDRAPHGFEADAVLTGNADGSAGAVKHLADRGHRRIAFLGDLSSIATARERFAGYHAAMAARGIAVPPGLVAKDLHSPESVAAAVAGMLDGPDAPTALFTAQNNITVAAIRCLQERGLENEVALVGFDDFPLANLLRPGVTVMAQDAAAVGRQAAEILFARLAGDDSPVRTVTVRTRLLVRGSGEIPPAD